MSLTKFLGPGLASSTRAILLGGLIVTLLAVGWVMHAVDEQSHASFDRLAVPVERDVLQRFTTTAYGLSGVVAALAANQQVGLSMSRAQFRTWVDARDLSREFPGVRGFGFIQRVVPENLERFVAAERADGAPDFTVRQLDDRGQPDLYVIKQIEPLAANGPALGLDIGSEPRRRAAIQRAIAEARITITAPLPLVQDGQKTPGFLIFKPVYHTRTADTVPELRASSLVGVVYAPVVARELLAGIMNPGADLLDFELHSGHGAAARDPASLVHDNDGHLAGAGTAGTPLEQRINRRFVRLREVMIFDQPFTLAISGTPRFDATVASLEPWVAGIAGLLLTALLAMVSEQASSGRRRAEALAASMTTDLDRLAMVARRTSDAVVITDAQRRITWVNAGFERLTGYTAAEAIGRIPGDLLHSAHTDPAMVAQVRAALARGEGFRGELLHRSKQGSDHWVSEEIQPMRGDDGALLGFMAIQSDISAQRSALQALEAARAEAQRLAMVAERTSNPVIITDRALRIEWVNDAFTRLYGYRLDEAVGRTPGALIGGPHSSPEALATLAAAAEAGTGCRVEVVNRTADGRDVWVDTEVQPRIDADGTVCGFVEVASDITARRAADARLASLLRENSAFLATIRAHTIVSMADADGRITEVNDAFCRISGYTREDLLGQDHRIVNSGVQPKAFWTAMWSTIRAGRPWRGQVCNRAKDGSLYWVDSIVAPFTGADGRIEKYVSIRHDITERKAAEAALHASQAFLDRTGRIAGVGGWQLDLDTQALRWTDQTCRLHEVPPGQQVTVDAAIAFYAEEARATIDGAVRHAIATGEGYDLELPLVTARGRRLWVRTVGEVQHEDGRPVRLVGAIQDITSRRALEDELRQHNQRMATVLENLPCGLSVFDGDLRLVASNRRYAELLAFPPALFGPAAPSFESFIRFNAERGEYGPGDVDAIVRQALERASGPVVPHRFERTRADGTVLEVRGGPMPGGGFVTTYTDVTEQRQAEQALRQRERMLQLVIDCFPGPLAHWDTQERCTIANRAYRGWMGLEPEAMVGRTQRALVGPEVYALNAPMIAAALRGEVQCVERSRVLPDGRTVEYMLWYHPDRDGDTVRGFVSSVVDITELKAIQRRLEERTAQAEEASVAKSRFLANMSHEIRTPMNAILGMLALLRRTPLSPRQEDYAVKSERAAQSLLGLLNDILDFSKIEANKLVLDPQPVDLDHLLGDLSVIFAANLGSKPVELLFDLPADVPRHLLVDGLRLQQVLINLVGNAIKFTERGEVVLAIRRLGGDGDRVRLGFAVRDTGIGIAPENQARIFAGFTQAEASTTRRFGGTGLGVSISQRIVGLMGGTLALQSALGEGTCFSFEIDLPLLAATDNGQDAGGAARRVLVVDDHPVARELIAQAAAAPGWDVDTAADGAMAIRLVEAAVAARRPYDAVFVDWRMPGLDGWQTVTALRAGQRDRQHQAIVMVSAHGHGELMERSERERSMIDGFIVKPVTTAMLVNALSGRTARDAAGVPAPAPLQGLRLLVAEDNENNQQVARELLEGEGAAITIAGDGAQAVASVAAQPAPFDLVLMDLQMPVMDGFEATRRIRALPQGATLPIVAMTANAMQSDRDACLAAGMNDHVGKPFDLARLVEVILRQVGRADPAPSWAPAPSRDACGPRSTAQAEARGVALAAALGRMGGRTDVYLRMLRGFIPQLESLLDALGTDADAGRAEAVRRHLHTAKGVAATLGMRALATTLAQAETDVQDGASIPALHGAIAPVVGSVVDARDTLPLLVRALEQDAAEAGGGAPAAPAIDLRPALQRLAALLRDSDLAAIDVLADVAAGCGSARPPWLEGLEQAVHGMDFDAALQQALAALDAPDPVAA